jgi:hypothetical protein
MRGTATARSRLIAAMNTRYRWRRRGLLTWRLTTPDLLAKHHNLDVVVQIAGRAGSQP